MKPRLLSPEALEQICIRWNKANAIGARVLYVKDDRTEVATATRSEAYVLSGHTPVIFLENVRGCIALDRVRVSPWRPIEVPA